VTHRQRLSTTESQPAMRLGQRSKDDPCRLRMFILLHLSPPSLTRAQRWNYRAE